MAYPTRIAEALAFINSGIDRTRDALGIWRDIRDGLTEGREKEGVTTALEKLEEELLFAESEIFAICYQLLRSEGQSFPLH